MIDIHCHILPVIDDGAANIEEAIEMAKMAALDGITDIIATPHTEDGVYQISATQVMESIQSLQARLDQANIPIHIHPGSEVHIHQGLVSHLQTEQILSLANQKKYVLLELPVYHLPRFTEEILADLKHSGITPILAHPEHIVDIQENPDLLARWILEYGALAQLTATSILGLMGKKKLKFSRFLVKHKLVHFVASDAHNIRNRRPLLNQAYLQIAQINQGAADQFKRNARAVLHGEPCQWDEPIFSYHKRKWMMFL